MQRKNRKSKGILGVPRRAERQVFVFGKYAEALPSDDSDDPDFDPRGEETTAAKREGLNEKERKGVKKRKACREQKTESGTGQTDVGNDTVKSSDTCMSLGWSETIPTEILLLIFQYAMNQLQSSSVPFLCRMSRVCRRWREVASEPKLWKTVNLSTEEVNITKSAKILNKLVSTRLKYTRELVLRGWSKLTDREIKALGKHCHKLQCIDLSECESLTSQGIASLADDCRHITSIGLKSTKIDITGLQHIIAILGAQLECLFLENCNRLTGGRILPLIQENCPNLRILDISGTNARTFPIEKLQAGCPKLRKLFLANLLLHSTPKTNEKKANGFPDLQFLEWSGFYHGMQCTNDHLLRILRSSHNLESLIIRGPNLITAEGFSSLPDCPLKTLTFHNASFSSFSAVVNKWHGTLESLDISSSRDVGDNCMELLDNEFEMQKLRDLDVNNTNITSIGLRFILNGCPNLRLLNLISCRGLPRGFKTIHREQAIQGLRRTLLAGEGDSN